MKTLKLTISLHQPVDMMTTRIETILSSEKGLLRSGPRKFFIQQLISRSLDAQTFSKNSLSFLRFCLRYHTWYWIAPFVKEKSLNTSRLSSKVSSVTPLSISSPVLGSQLMISFLNCKNFNFCLAPQQQLSNVELSLSIIT